MKHVNKNWLIVLLCALLFSCGGSEKKKAFPTFEKAKIGVLGGTSYERFMSQRYPNANLKVFDNNADLFLALTQGKVDLMLYDGVSFTIDKQHSKDVYAIYKDSLLEEKFGVAFKKNDNTLREEFNTFLKKIRKDGTYQRIYDNWLLPNSPCKMPSLDSIKRSGEPIKAVVSGAYDGFDMILEGKNAGFDPEMLQRFAAYMGRPLEISTMNFAAMLPAIQSGKYHLAASSIAITPERSKQVDFSDTYLSSFCVALALRKNLSEEETKNEQDAVQLFKGKRVGVLLGGTQEKHVSSLMRGQSVKLCCYETVADMYLALETGKIDMVDDDGILAGITNYNKGYPYKIVIDTLVLEPLGIIFNKKQTKLLAEFNKYLDAIKANGKLKQIRHNWLEPGGKNIMPDFSKVKRRGKPIKVSCCASTPYFDIIKDGRNAGYDIEILESFAAHLGRPIEFHASSFASSLAAVTSGKMDVGTGGVTITKERQKNVNFSHSHISSRASVFMMADKPRKEIYTSLKDLSTRSLGVLGGSSQDIYISEACPKAKLQRAESPTLIGALAAHKCDAVILPYTQAQEVVRKSPSLAILDCGMETSEIAVAFSKKNNELRSQFNKYLAAIKKDGTYKHLVQKYLENKNGADNITGAVNMGDPSLPLLRVATTGVTYPYSFTKDEHLMGFDIELCADFARSIGRRVKFLVQSFETIMPAVVSGKADLAANMILITNERQKVVDFSDGYYFSKSCAVIRKENHPDWQGATTVKASSSLTRLKDSFVNNLIHENRYKLILDGLWNTLFISIFSILLGTVIGAVICAMRMSRSRLISYIAKIYIDAMRGTPVLVLLMIVFYVVFAKVEISALLVAVIAFAMNFGAYASEMFRTSIQGVSRGQREAGIAMGFTPFSTFRFIILPQALRNVLPVYKGEAISSLKATSIVGYIAVQDLTKASDIIRSRTFDAFFPLIVITVIYFAIAWLLGWVLDRIGKHINKRK